jgi:hypothetical protein
MKTKILLLLISFAFVIVARGQVINVPGDRMTIQAGIDAAVNGDTVLVADGSYIENINFKGKAITVASHFIMDGDTNHINNTVINGSQPSDPDSGSVVMFISGEDTNSVICGFTITGGTGTYLSELHRIGGGVVSLNSGSKIIHNRINGNNVFHPSEWAGGGGIYISGNVILKNNIVENNNCHNTANSWIADGGGIEIEQWPGFQIEVKITNNSVRYNTIEGTNTYGAGIMIIRSGADVSGNTISYNIATGDSCFGGGICIYYPVQKTEITNNYISNNSIITLENYWFGAGVNCMNPNAEVVFRNNEFSNNSGQVAPIGAGGGFSVTEAYMMPVTIDANKFLNNTAYHGGGIFERSCWNLNVVNNLFINNSAFRGAGIGMYHPVTDNDLKNLSQRDLHPLIINNTFSGDSATNDAGAIRYQGDQYPPEVFNCIFWDNSAPDGKDVSNWSPGSLVISYSDIDTNDISGVWNGVENIFMDPLFAGGVENPYALSEDSPCIDAGNLDITDLNLPEWDILGNFRIWDGDDDGDTIVDMGAYEYGSIPINLGIPENFIQRSDFQIQNYPNPFLTSTTIEVEMKESGFAEVLILNQLGQIIDKFSCFGQKGKNQVNWDAGSILPGIYFCRITSGKQVAIGKMVKL